MGRRHCADILAVDPDSGLAKTVGTADDGVGALAQGQLMAHTYGISEVVGTSETPIDDAIRVQ